MSDFSVLVRLGLPILYGKPSSNDLHLTITERTYWIYDWLVLACKTLWKCKQNKDQMRLLVELELLHRRTSGD